MHGAQEQLITTWETMGAGMVRGKAGGSTPWRGHVPLGDHGQTMTPTHHALSEQQPRRSSPLGAVELSSRSDEDLLELVAERRDEAAFDEFYGRYGRAVYAVVCV